MSGRSIVGMSVVLALCVALALTCGGNDGGSGSGGSGGNGGSDGNQSNVDFTGFAATAPAGPDGGTVQMPGGPVLSVPPGAFSEDGRIGLRPTVNAPSSPASGGTLVSGWYDAASSLSDVQASPSSPVTIGVPIDPPAGSADHPGLRMVVLLPDDAELPVDGKYDAAAGVFRVDLLGLPPFLTFAVVFNQNIQLLEGSAVETSENPAAHTLDLDSTWATTGWDIYFDGLALTLQDASKLLRYARRAATLYSQAGFREPTLAPCRNAAGACWPVHLTKGGGYYGDADPSAADPAVNFGRIYIDPDRLDDEPGGRLGSGFAAIAHELMHAVFASYGIKYWCSNYAVDGVMKSRRSSVGLNEGAATAIGYSLDQMEYGAAGQREPRPRPSNPKTPLDWMLGSYDIGKDCPSCYRNQDFYVFLLRAFDLTTIAHLFEGLRGTRDVPNPGPMPEDEMSFYAEALDGSATGLDIDFMGLLLAYLGQRGFIRDHEGYLYAEDPVGGTPGEQYVLDRTLFPDCKKSVRQEDCKVTQSPLEAVCEVTFQNRPPMSGCLVEADVSALSHDWGFPTTSGRFSVEAPGKAAMWAFGVKDGKSAQEASAQAGPGEEAALSDLGVMWPQVNLLVENGTKNGNIKVRLTFPEDATVKVYRGNGTYSETSGVSTQSPGTCQETVEMEGTVNTLFGWVDLKFKHHEWKFAQTGNGYTCTMGTGFVDVSGFASDITPDGHFELWDVIPGAFDENHLWGSGEFTNTAFDNRYTIEFDLPRYRP